MNITKKKLRLIILVSFLLNSGFKRKQKIISRQIVAGKDLKTQNENDS